MALFTLDTGGKWLRPELVTSWGEIIAVLVVAIGYPAGTSTWMALHGSSHRFVGLLFSDSYLLKAGAMESGLLALFLGFLHWRKWRPADFKIKLGWLSSLEGIALLIVMFVGHILALGGMILALVMILKLSLPGLLAFLVANGPQLKPHSIHLSWVVLISTMVLNAFVEELTCMGYAFNQFAAKRGPLFALVTVVLLRMSCHSYQGPWNVFQIGVVFLIFGLWYWRTQKLWPLIFAHLLMDISAGSFVKVSFG